MATPIQFAVNHMAVPDRTVAELMSAARALGLDAVEIRNDIDGQAIADGTSAGEIRRLAEQANIRIISINALQRFNHWTDERADEARALAAYARDCGAEALVMCPVNDIDWQPGADDRAAGLHAALDGLRPILADAGLTGLIEPLGFEECSLRYKSDAIAAITHLDLAGQFKLVHDTFHHHRCGEPAMFPAQTGLVHISGVDDRTLPFPEIRDPSRVLIGDDDILGNVAQIKALRAAGYEGVFSFEPFARGFEDDEIATCIRYLRDRLVA